MSETPDKPGTVSVGILAGHIESTGHWSAMGGHQFKMGHYFHFSIHPDVAKQWIDALTPIAEEGP